MHKCVKCKYFTKKNGCHSPFPTWVIKPEMRRRVHGSTNADNCMLFSAEEPVVGSLYVGDVTTKDGTTPKLLRRIEGGWENTSDPSMVWSCSALATGIVKADYSRSDNLPTLDLSTLRIVSIWATP